MTNAARSHLTVGPLSATGRARLGGLVPAPVFGAIAGAAVGLAWAAFEGSLPESTAAAGIGLREVVELAVVSLLGAVVAFVARRGRDANEVTLRSLRESEWRFQQLLGGIALGATVLDTEGRLVFANDQFLRMTGRSREEVVGEDWASMFSPPDFPLARWREILASLAAGTHDEHVPARIRCADGSIRDVIWTNATLRDPDGAPLGMVGLCEDVTERRRADAERARLAAAVEQASDAILIADEKGRIVYANPASARVLGAAPRDLVGHDSLPLVRNSGLDLATVAEKLRSSPRWKGEIEWLDPESRPQHLDVSVSAILSEQGGLTNYVGVARDVTREREIESRLGREAVFRRRLADTIARLGPRDTPEETAAAICAEIVRLDGFSGAAIFAFPGEDDALVLAHSGHPGLPLSPGRRLPPARAAYLRERAANGAWIEPWRARPEDGAYGTEMAASGLKVVAYAPISNGLGPLGVLAISTFDAGLAALLPERLPAVAELAVAASSLLGSTLHRWRETADLRIELAELIATRAFYPVFQPVMDLRSEHVVGYEALCRFPDGASPLRRFAEARRVGLGPDLEIGAIERALEESGPIQGDAWLSVNCSPALLLEHGERLAATIRSRRHRLVLEVTENEPVADYEKLRAFVRSLGPDVSLGVDDAGAGSANFSHIVELRPAIVKIDAGLVRGVDRDHGRQALVVAMLHFAASTRCDVVAEGIETEPERDMLAGLGVALGQGYLLGRPGRLT